MWMHVLYFEHHRDKVAAMAWVKANVGYFEISDCLGPPFHFKFYTVELPESEQATIKEATKATSYLIEEL
jgi:hypothetical protein